jgi:hypothetical protein
MPDCPCPTVNHKLCPCETARDTDDQARVVPIGMTWEQIRKYAAGCVPVEEWEEWEEMKEGEG